MLQVFFYVPSATVDLSAFGTNQASLIESLQSAHRSIRFRSLPEQRKVSIEGPFSAVKSLREDLIQRASRLQLSAQSPSHPRTHLGSVGSKVQQEAASSSGLSASQQSTGEPREVQSLLWKAKTQKDCLRQTFSDESFAGGRFSDTDSVEEEEEPKAQSRREVSTKYRTERTQTNLRQVVGEEVGAGIVPSFSGLKLAPAGEISAKQQREDSFLEKRRKGENHLGSHHRSTDSPKNWSSFNSKFPQTGLRDASTFSERYTKDVYPADSEDVWVDLYTFRYIEKFDKKELDKCLKGVDMSVECVKGSGLVRISLTEKQPRKVGSRIVVVALEDLKTLMEFWQSILRVHEIFYNEAEWPDEQKLTQICDEENFLFLNVLYVFEDSCIKVIGPSVDSHLFYSRVEDKMMKLKDFRMNSSKSNRRLKKK